MRLTPQRLFLPLLVSFSLSGAGVFLIYLLNKKKEEEEKAKSAKSQQNKREIKIPYKLVPAVIGRGGSVLNDIQKTTRTSICFKEENDIDSPERTCVITGTPECIDLAEEKIKCILKNLPIIETYETWVPQRTINRLSERGSELINQIQNSSSAKIILENNLNSSDLSAKKRVILKGTAKQIADALLQIEDQVREDKEEQSSTESSPLNRVPRVRTPSYVVPENNSHDVSYSNEIFGDQANESLLQVFISAAENPSQFYIQVIGPINRKLDDLVKEMTDYYESEENREIHILNNISVGKIVAAKFSDGRWYRAEVIADLGNELYDVYFVDFGDRDKIEGKHVLELRTDFLSLRLQAIEVSLAGVKPRDGEWSTQACEVFFKLSDTAQWEPRIAKIRGYKERAVGIGSRREGSPIPCIELYQKRGEQLFNIGKELIRLELACAESEPWSAASSTLSLSRRSVDSRARSPEVPTNGHEHNGSADAAWTTPPKSVEEIDLTSTPEPKKTAELIDLTTPVRDSRNGSRSFIENERSTAPRSNGSGHYKKAAPVNPFKRESARPVNIMPAGFESEASDDSDGFEMN